MGKAGATTKKDVVVRFVACNQVVLAVMWAALLRLAFDWRYLHWSHYFCGDDDVFRAGFCEMDRRRDSPKDLCSETRLS